MPQGKNSTSDAPGRPIRRLGPANQTPRGIFLSHPAPSPSGPSFISFRTQLHLPPNPASYPSGPSFISLWTQLHLPLDPASYPTGTLQAYFRHTPSILQAYSNRLFGYAYSLPSPCKVLAISLQSTCHLLAKAIKNGFCPLIAEPEKCSIRYRGSVHLPWTSPGPPLDHREGKWHTSGRLRDCIS